MSSSKRCILAVMVSVLAVGANVPLAADAATATLQLPGKDVTDSDPVTRSTRLVTFRYSPDTAFAVRSLANVFTNIEVPEGEKIQGFYLSDAVAWSYHVTGDKRRVLVKPTEAGAINTGTLVTDARTYELTFSAVEQGDIWHQRVRWVVPGAGGESSGFYEPTAGAAGQGAPSGGSAGVDPASLHFNYEVKGRADFRPTVVFDDGVRTWFRFDGAQDIPAIFAGKGRNIDVVEFAVRDGYVVVPAIADTFTLRLKREEVIVQRSGTGRWSR